MQPKANYHTHTTFCDGSHSAEDVVLEAIKKGFSHLGFSGHMDPGVWMDFPQYVSEIERLQQKYKDRIDIILGAELDTVYGPEAAPGVEYHIGSTHFIPIPGSEVWEHTVPFGSHRETEPDTDIFGVDAATEIIHDSCKKYYGGDYYAMSERYYAFESMVCNRLKPAFIGHFDLITRFNDLSKSDGGHFLDETDERYLRPARKAMEALVKYCIPFEINCGAINRGRKAEPYPRIELLKYLKELGGEILISSDAHQKDLLDGGFDTAVSLARDAGFDHINILVRKTSIDVERDIDIHSKTAASMKVKNVADILNRKYIPAKNTRDNINGGCLYWKQLPLN